MGLNSMTGFARAQDEFDGVSWYWELRSVNGRGLDVRTRLGPGMEVMDTAVRSCVGKVLKRGNINVLLNVSRSEGAVQIQLNEAALAQVIEAANRVMKLVSGCEPIRPEGLLSLKGVLEANAIQEDEEQVAVRHKHMMGTFQSALQGLVDARADEGEGLSFIVSEQLDEIERLVGVVSSSKARSPEAIHMRLKEQVARITDVNSGLDDDRLYQEAALLATRCDVEEELKRLEQHVAAGRALLKEEGPVGRKLDFLAQEFNREANTLCSKSNDGVVTKAGVALKVVIDQMREQVQNIE